MSLTSQGLDFKEACFFFISLKFISLGVQAWGIYLGLLLLKLGLINSGSSSDLTSILDPAAPVSTFRQFRLRLRQKRLEPTSSGSETLINANAN